MHRPVDRQFYAKPESTNKSHFNTPSRVERERLVDNVANSIIGKDKTFCGPFGQRQVVYLDYTASGRALSFIEDYIQKEVLPEYGNTHTTTSVTSLQTTLFRHEARDIIRNAVNASEHDSVIFTGSGTTGAIHKLIHALNLKEPPVVFVGPHEHHSNLLPWKEISAEVVTIEQTEEGVVDLSDLEHKLKVWTSSNRQLIGSFSAASNVTGILCDVDAVTVLLHRYGALAFWDYATAAPYVRLDMNPVVSGKDAGLIYKDAMFFSPHKFVGGTNTPGVLVAKKRLFQSDVPHHGGGGTVFYVRREAHRYLQEPELKEEGGTPDIVGSVRAGLVFQLKSAITADLIMHREHQLFRQAAEVWGSVPNLVILGNMEVERLPIFSFIVYNPASGLFLHHNYVSALLNDLFGIQARGGCACAGPYAMDLLGLTEEKAAVLEELLAEDSRLDRVHLRRYMEYSHREILRPGFTRLNLPYFMGEDQVEFVLQAVSLVAQHGWKLLPQYMFNPETGEWHHREQQVFKERKWLGHISYASGKMEYSLPKVSPKAPLPKSFQDCLNKAGQLFRKAEKSRPKLADQRLLFDEEARSYRWFLLPSEAADIMSGGQSLSPHPASSLPFCPHKLSQQLGCTSPEVSPPTPATQKPSTDCGDCAATTTNADAGNEEKNSSDSSFQTNERSQRHEEKIRGTKVQRSSDTPEEAPATFPDALQRAMERGYCGDVIQDGSFYTSEESQTIKDNVPSQPDLNQDVTECDNGDPQFEKVADTLVVEAEHSLLSLCTQDDRVHSQKNGGKLTTGVADRPEESVFDSERRTETNSAGCNLAAEKTETERTFKTDSGAGSISSESQSEPRIPPPLVSDSSQNRTADSQSQDCSQETDSELRGAAVCSEPSQCVSSSKAKSKKKKKAKKKNDAGQCVQNGVCELRGRQPAPPKKEEVVGNRWVAPSKEIFTPAVKAMEEFSMIKDGDRVLICVSGGKDSLSLLHTVRQYQFYCRRKGIQFDFGAVTVDPQTSSYDPSPLKEVMADLGVPYLYESQGIIEMATNLPYECASICNFCSRMKRGRIYAAARRAGYNVVALGQHLDDLAESFMMSLFHNGTLRTMKAHYTAESDIRVIRPFVYVREKDLRNFAEKNKLPVIAENCPACFEAPKERHRTKQLLASQEVLFPRLYSSMQSAIKPVMSISHTGRDARFILNKVNQEDDYLGFKYEAS